FEHLSRDELTSLEDYADGVTPFLEKRGLASIDRATLLGGIPLYRPRAETWVDAAEAMDYLFREPPVMDEKAAKKFLVPDKASRLKDFRDLITTSQVFEAQPLEAYATEWLQKQGLELKEVAQPARVAVTGRTASRPLFDVLALLGKDRAMARLDRA